MTVETTKDKMLVVAQQLQTIEDKRGEMTALLSDLELLAQQIEHTTAPMTAEERRVFANLQFSINEDYERLYSMQIFETMPHIDEMRSQDRDGELAPFAQGAIK